MKDSACHTKPLQPRPDGKWINRYPENKINQETGESSDWGSQCTYLCSKLCHALKLEAWSPKVSLNEPCCLSPVNAQSCLNTVTPGSQPPPGSSVLDLPGKNIVAVCHSYLRAFFLLEVMPGWRAQAEWKTQLEWMGKTTKRPWRHVQEKATSCSLRNMSIKRQLPVPEFWSERALRTSKTLGLYTA